MIERFERLDDRMTEAYRGIADQNQRLDAMATKNDISELKSTPADHSQRLDRIEPTQAEQGQDAQRDAGPAEAETR